MGEGHIQKFTNRVRLALISWIALAGLLLVAEYWLLDSFLKLQSLTVALIMVLSWILIAIFTGLVLASKVTKPTQYLAQAILHISPSEHLVPPPSLESLKLGRELVESLTRQVYDFATVTENNTPEADTSSSPILNQLPVAVIGIAENNLITLANTKAQKLINIKQVIGQQLKNTLNFSVEGEDTIEAWLKDCRQKSLTSLNKWQKVEVRSIDNQSLGYFDIAISFNKHSGSGTEAIIAFYDHSEAYGEEEDSISFVALAVHELRTPLTVMRGYIEAFKEDIGSTASPQVADDLQKMSASADSLTSFVSNILNVARINNGQLSLKLQQDDWNKALPQIIDGLRTRATVYGKTIELRMQPDLPAVAIDRMTVGEVITNLIENAIKYSPVDAKKIAVVSYLNQDGLIETTVQDQGVGIPSSVMPNLFSKFYRNHRNQAQIGGTGLGLFLSKAIVSAHGGNIWANSKENQGSTFGFTLMQFSMLAKEQQNNNNGNIIRSSHGWIKNHTLQRR